MDSIINTFARAPARARQQAGWRQGGVLLVWVMVLGLAGCASGGRVADSVPGAPRYSVAVLGLDGRPGVQMPEQIAELQRSMIGEMARRGMLVVEPDYLQKQVGSEQIKRLRSQFARNSWLAPDEVAALARAAVPALTVLVLRLDENWVSELPPQPLPPAVGENEWRELLQTQREVVISAALYNIGSGELAWDGRYRITPVTRKIVGGDVFAAPTSTDSNVLVKLLSAGRDTARTLRHDDSAPAAPALDTAVARLLAQVAVEMPLP